MSSDKFKSFAAAPWYIHTVSGYNVAYMNQKDNIPRAPHHLYLLNKIFLRVILYSNGRSNLNKYKLMFVFMGVSFYIKVLDVLFKLSFLSWNMGRILSNMGSNVKVS